MCLLVEGDEAFFPCYEAWWIIWRAMRLGPIRNETARKDDSNSDWSRFCDFLKYQPMMMSRTKQYTAGNVPWLRRTPAVYLFSIISLNRG